MRLVRNKTYRISWWDIHHTSEWENESAVVKFGTSLKPAVNTLTYKCSIPNFYVFTSGEAGDGDLYDAHFFPKKVIVKIKEVR